MTNRYFLALVSGIDDMQCRAGIFVGSCYVKDNECLEIPEEKLSELRAWLASQKCKGK